MTLLPVTHTPRPHQATDLSNHTLHTDHPSTTALTCTHPRHWYIQGQPRCLCGKLTITTTTHHDTNTTPHPPPTTLPTPPRTIHPHAPPH